MKTRGINHLAMVTNDMEKTVRFYREVMGFPLVAAIGGNPNGLRARHYFFETGTTRPSLSSNGRAPRTFISRRGWKRQAGFSSTTFPSM